MAKLAQHHHPARTYEVMEKAQEWFARIAIIVALAGGAVALVGLLTAPGHVTW
jgi:hypothetical protein